ncbi:hypothetical protein BLNAU_2336 [Blattamonas nauphoetae]|uniref:Uncharacterized protein n=1 Tax=Blattamonas nauphoetae TaxID=2049346 RepID=A0ABQ9YFF5_9EUKA|nr:hypothetical protein BLNAU_2336 [Blattamonas nauphoetae]
MLWDGINASINSQNTQRLFSVCMKCLRRLGTDTPKWTDLEHRAFIIIFVLSCYLITESNAISTGNHRLDKNESGKRKTKSSDRAGNLILQRTGSLLDELCPLVKTVEIEIGGEESLQILDCIHEMSKELLKHPDNFNSTAFSLSNQIKRLFCQLFESPLFSSRSSHTRRGDGTRMEKIWTVAGKDKTIQQELSILLSEHLSSICSQKSITQTFPSPQTQIIRIASILLSITPSIPSLSFLESALKQGLLGPRFFAIRSGRDKGSEEKSKRDAVRKNLVAHSKLFESREKAKETTAPVLNLLQKKYSVHLLTSQPPLERPKKRRKRRTDPSVLDYEMLQTMYNEVSSELREFQFKNRRQINENQTIKTALSDVQSELAHTKGMAETLSSLQSEARTKENPPMSTEQEQKIEQLLDRVEQLAEASNRLNSALENQTGTDSEAPTSNTRRKPHPKYSQQEDDLESNADNNEVNQTQQKRSLRDFHDQTEQFDDSLPWEQEAQFQTRLSELEEKERILAQKITENEQKEQALRDREERLTRAEEDARSSMIAQQNSLAERQEELNNQEYQIQTREAELSQREEEDRERIRAESDRLATKEEEINQHEENMIQANKVKEYELQQREEEMDEKQRAMETKEDELSRREEELRRREDELGRREGEHQKREEDIQRREQEHVQREEDLQKQMEDHLQKVEECEQREENQKHRETEIQRLAAREFFHSGGLQLFLTIASRTQEMEWTTMFILLSAVRNSSRRLVEGDWKLLSHSVQSLNVSPLVQNIVSILVTMPPTTQEVDDAECNILSRSKSFDILKTHFETITVPDCLSVDWFYVKRNPNSPVCVILTHNATGSLEFGEDEETHISDQVVEREEDVGQDTSSWISKRIEDAHGFS